MLTASAIDSSAQEQEYPRNITVQGYLEDPATSGPVLDEKCTLLIKIYPGMASDEVLYQELLPDVQLYKGVFSVSIGPLDAVFTNQINKPGYKQSAYYLGIKVEDNPELKPRTKLATVPYALSVDPIAAVTRLAFQGVDTMSGYVVVEAGEGISFDSGAGPNSVRISVSGDAALTDNVLNAKTWRLGGNLDIDTNIFGTLDAKSIDIRTDGNSAIAISGTTQDVNILNNLDVDTNLNVDGITTLDMTTVDGTFSQTGGGQVTISGNIDADSGLDIAGADLTVATNAAISGTISVNGSTTLNGNVDLGNTVADAVTLNGTLTGLGSGHVLGAAGLDAAVLRIDGSPLTAPAYELDVQGDVNIAGLLALPDLIPGAVVYVDGAGNLATDNPPFAYEGSTNTMTTGNLSVLDNATLGDDPALDVQTLNGQVTVNESSAVPNTHALSVNEIGDGRGISVVETGEGAGILANESDDGPGFRIDESGAGHGITVNEVDAGNGITVNVAGAGAGIVVNGGAIDGNAAANELGDGAAARQLDVLGTADAAIGNTITGNPTVWDQVITGDLGVTGIIKSGGSIWIDGVNDEITSNGALSVTTTIGSGADITINSDGGTTTVDDNLVVTGTSDLQGNVSNSTGDVVVDDNLNVTGSADIDTDLNVDGNTVHVGTLDQQGNVSNTTGDVIVDDNLNVTGSADIDTDLNVDGNTVHVGRLDQQGSVSNSTGDVVVDDNLNVTGSADIDTDLNVDGNTVHVGRLDQQGNVSNTTGDVVVDDNLNVTGSADIDTDLNVDGNTVHVGTLDQQGNVSNTTGDVVIDDDANVTGSLDIDTDLNVNGNATLNGNVDLGDAAVDAVTLKGTLTSAGSGHSLGTVALDANVLTINGLVNNAPAYELVVNGDAQVTGVLSFPGQTPNAVMFVDGTGNMSTEATAGDFYWDETNNRLGIGNGTVVPTEALDITGNIEATGTIQSGTSIIIDGTTPGSHNIATTGAEDLAINPGGGDLVINGNTNITGNADIDTDLNVDGNTVHVGTLDQQGSVSNTTGDVVIDDDANVTGSLDVDTDLNVDGNTVHVGKLDQQGSVSNSTGDVVVDDNLNVTGSADIDTDLNVDGNTVHVGTLDQQGNVSNTTGDVVIDDNLNVTGSADIDTDLNVDGNTTHVGTLDQQGSVSNTTGDVVVDDNLNVTGSADIDTDLNVDGNTTHVGTLDQQGSVSNTTGDVVVDDNLNVTGSADIDTDLNVDGNTTHVGTLDQQGSVSNTTGDVVIDDDANVTGSLDVDTDLNIDGNTVHVGITDLQGAVGSTVGPVDIQDDVDISGDLDVGTGNFTVAGASGNTDVGGTLDVTGAVTLDNYSGGGNQMLYVDNTGTVQSSNAAAAQNATGIFTGQTTIVAPNVGGTEAIADVNVVAGSVIVITRFSSAGSPLAHIISAVNAGVGFTVQFSAPVTAGDQINYTIVNP